MLYRTIVIDALVQSMGRVNRYGERQPASVYIFTKQYSKSNKIYSERLRNKSLEVLTSLANPLTEEDLNNKEWIRLRQRGYTGKDKDEYEEVLTTQS